MSIQENVNAYDVDAFKSSFIKTDLYKAIAKNYQYLHWEKFFDPMQPNAFHLATKSKHRKRWPNEYSLTPFYYLNFLLEKNPTTIYDLGCGDNSFKKYIPNIIGIDPDNSLETTKSVKIPTCLCSSLIVVTSQRPLSILSQLLTSVLNSIC